MQAGTNTVYRVVEGSKTIYVGITSRVRKNRVLQESSASWSLGLVRRFV
jgi:hypothetical protein